MKSTNVQRGLVIVVLLFGVFAIDEWGIRWYQSPWSYAALGPTLTGTWEGTLRARLGSEYRLFLDLRYRHQGRRLTRFDSNVTGQGWLCSRTGDVYEYAVDGTASRSGDTVQLTLDNPDPARSALNLSIDGSWNGETITLRPTRNPFQPDGTFLLNRSISTADPDDSFGPAELRNGDRAAFLAACGRLAR